MNNNTILAIVFLMAGTLLTTAVTTMVPAVYAEGDDHDDRDDDGKRWHDDDHDNDNGDGNKLEAEDESAGAIADCDDNEVERAGFTCVPIAAADIEVDLGRLLGLASGLSAEE